MILFFLMSLYRKYRPNTFNHLVGQDHVNRTLENALKLGKVNHAYLFTGPRGTGKTSTARLLAKAINCLNPKESEPCNECEICTDINDGRLIDLIEIDAASNRGIDEIRDLKEKINFAPTRAKSKVYIIDEVHMLTKEAFNALLKTLEEPPEHVYFILATTEVHKIPETILSRCQRFDFRRIEDSVLVDRLKYIAGEEGIDADTKALEMIAHHSEGGMRDSIGLLEQLTVNNKLTYDHVCLILGVSGVVSMEKLFDALSTSDAKRGMEIINELYSDGFDLSYFTKRFLEYLRKKMVKSVAEGKNAETQHLLNCINYFQEAHNNARFAVIPQLPIEMAVVKSCLGGVTMMAAPIKASHQNEKKVEVASNRVTTAKTISEDSKKESAVITKANVGAPSDQVTEASETEISTREGSSEELTAVLSLEEVKEKWYDFLNKIKSPIVKRSLQHTTPLKIQGANLVLAFGNNFNREKVMETDNRNNMEKDFETYFGHQIKIEGEIHKMAGAFAPKKPDMEETSEIGKSGVSGGEARPNGANTSKGTLENEVMDIFF